MRPSHLLRLVAATIALTGAAHAHAQSFFKAAPCEVPGMRELILQQVNSHRARGADCGGQRFGAARAVSWNDRLYSAASAHSRDMAEHNYFDHVSLRGTQPGDRAEAHGYKWRSVAENIAAGDTYTVHNVVAGWMNSPGHCVNVMDPGYTEVAVACVARPGSSFGSYWTMVLGRR